jgi:hypothetical protein
MAHAAIQALHALSKHLEEGGLTVIAQQFIWPGAFAQVLEASDQLALVNFKTTNDLGCLMRKGGQEYLPPFIRLFFVNIK